MSAATPFHVSHALSVPFDIHWSAMLCRPATSDGLKLYFYALTAHFGGWVETLGRQKSNWQVHAQLLYGQVVKQYRRRRLVRVERRA